MKPDFAKFAYTGKMTRSENGFQLYFQQEGWAAVLRVGSANTGHWFSDCREYSGDLTPEETELLLMKLR